MSDLYLDIVDMLEMDYNPKNISRILNIPIYMVYDIMDELEKENFENSNQHETY
jgi:hypothetical protein